MPVLYAEVGWDPRLVGAVSDMTVEQTASWLAIKSRTIKNVMISSASDAIVSMLYNEDHLLPGSMSGWAGQLRRDGALNNDC